MSPGAGPPSHQIVAMKLATTTTSQITAAVEYGSRASGRKAIARRGG